VTIVHKGNIMKFTEGAFRDWGYARRARVRRQGLHLGQWEKHQGGARARRKRTPSRRRPSQGAILIKDAIADITLQQVLTRPDEFDVIATLNLNGDYLSDALAAQVGGIGIAPGGNINYVTGHAVFEATHGTAPKYADLDKVNPGSVILSGEMMLRYMGWTEAADLIIKGMDGAIARSKTVTYDFARLMEGATEEVKCSEFVEEAAHRQCIGALALVAQEIGAHAALDQKGGVRIERRADRRRCPCASRRSARARDDRAAHHIAVARGVLGQAVQEHVDVEARRGCESRRRYCPSPSGIRRGARARSDARCRRSW
jgi:hypothetical protein